MSAQQYKGELQYSIPLSEWKMVIDERLARIARATQVVISERRSSVPISLQQEILVDKVYTADAIEKFKTTSIGQYVTSFPSRMAYLWSTSDTSPWAGGGIFHRIVQIEFLLLVLLVILGGWVSRGHLLEDWPLWIAPLYITIIHIVFHVEPRYSLPARPLLLVYAGIGLAFCWSRMKQLWIPSTPTAVTEDAK